MIVPWLIFIAVGLGIYTGFVKLAARLLRYRVSWRSSFLFAVIMLIVIILAHIIDVERATSTRVEHSLALLLASFIFGGWFFSRRGTDGDGAVLGWGGGVRLIGLAFAMIVIAAFTIAISTQAFVTNHNAASP